MSTTIDQKVVEMRFDNKHFEANVQESLSTLDKLKQKLNLKGATKGLEDVNVAAKNVNMAGLGAAVDTVRARFSALQVMGITALTNITNQAVNTGKRMLSALTIDPVKTGLQEYETQINAVQTILANTSSKGTTIDQVNEALEQLNKYADKTIYNFTEMTRNIGTFTAAGVDLDTSVSAIQGIANLAAVSGSTSQQASTAMYQLSQALAAGRVSLMDWNSVVNAGMGGEVFQNALKRTSEVMGTGAEAAIKKFGSFRESLTGGEWLTVDVLTETLNQFTMAAEEGSEQWEEYKKSLKEKGYTEAQAEEILKMANTATDAATKVKTFTQLWDVLKESAQSGWSQTWKLIIGDYEEAKALLTPLADFLTNIIGKFSDARNSLIEGALGKGFSHIIDELGGIAKPVEKAIESVEELGDIVDKVIIGDFGNGADRLNALTEAGYNYYRVQNKVNETLGDSFRYTDKQIAAQDELLGKTKKNTAAELESTEATAERIEFLMTLTEVELKALGYTDEQIAALKELAAVSDKLGIPLKELITNLDNINGRWLLWNSLKNIGMSLVDIFTSVGKAYRDIFPPMKADTLFDALAGFHKFTTQLKPTEETLDKLTRTFRGLFAAIDLVLTVAGGISKVLVKGIVAVLDGLGVSVLDVTANIGDAIVKARDWVDGSIDVLVKPIANFVSKIVNASSSVKTWIAGIKDAENIPKYILGCLISGLKGGAKAVIQTVIDLGKRILEGIRNVLGIESPSKEFMQIAKYCIEGFVEGFKKFASPIWDTIKTVGKKILDAVKGMDIGQLLAVGFGIAGVAAALKLLNILSKFAGVFESVGDILDNVSDVVFEFGRGIKRVSKSMSTWMYSMAVLNMAASIALLVTALKSLTEIDTDELWPAIGALGVLAGIVVAMFALVTLIGKIEGGTKKSILTILAISGSLVIMAFAVKMLAAIDIGGSERVLTNLAALIGGLIALSIAMRVLSSGKMMTGMVKVGVAMVAMVTSLLILTTAIKAIDQLDPDAITKGFSFMKSFGLFIGALIAVSALSGKYASKAGTMLIKISFALLLMVGVVKLVSRLDRNEISQGVRAIESMAGIYAALIAVSVLAGKYASRAGTMLLTASLGLLIMVGVISAISKIDDATIDRSLSIVTRIGALFVALIAVSVLAGKYAMKAGTMLLMVSGALLILTGVLFLIGEMAKNNPAKIYTALKVVSTLMLMFIGLIAVTGLAAKVQDLPKVLGILTGAVALLAVIIVALTFIEDQQALIRATACISTLMVMFGVMIGMSKFVNTTKGVIKFLFSMMLITALLTGVIVGLSQVNPDTAMKSVVALTTLLLAFSAALVILGHIGTVSQTIYGPMFALSAIVLLLAVVLGGMAALNLQGSIETAASLSLMLIAFTGALAILAAISPVAGPALYAMGVLGILIAGVAGIIASLAGISKLFEDGAMSAFFDTGIELFGKIGRALGTFVGEITAAFAESMLDVLPAFGTKLSEFMTNVQGFIDGASKIPLDIIVRIGALSGAIMALSTANLINGITKLTPFVGSLAGLGIELSAFMIAATPFIKGASEIKPEMIDGVSAIADMVLVLSAARFLDGIAKLFTGKSALSAFGEQLPGLGDDLRLFVTKLGSFGEPQIKTVDCAVKAIKAFSDVAQELPNDGGWVGKIFGNNAIGDFGTQLPKVGMGLNQFVTNLGTFTEAQVETTECACEVLGALAAVAHELPNDGGWVGKIFGENSIGAFADQLPEVATALTDFVSNLGTFTEDQVTTTDCAGRAIGALARAASEIPNDGGWVGKIFGENSLATFGSYLPGLGTNLAGFISNLGTFTDAQVTTVGCAGDAIVALAKAAETLPNDGGWVGKIFGENSIGTFSAQLPALGTNLTTFVSNLGTFTDAQVNTVSSAIGAINAFSALGNIDLKAFKKHIGDVGDKLNSFGTKIADFCSKMGEIGTTTLDSATSKVNKIIDMISKLSGVDTTSAANFKKAVNDVANSGVSKFTKAFTDTAATTDVQNAVKKMVDNGISAAESKGDDLKKALEKLVDKAVDGVEAKDEALKKPLKTAVDNGVDAIETNSNYIKFKDAGKYLVEGFAEGISQYTWQAEAKARAMASAAEAAAKAELQQNSPSKVFYRIGEGVGEGFVYAIEDYNSIAYKSSAAMANYARDGFSEAISKMSTMMSTDMDAQPTIRPVLDLSDVESGTGRLNGMLNSLGSTIGVSGRIGAVNAMMNSRIQNGGNADVVSAINKLDKHLDSVGNTTYSVNGITYNDGSDVADAVQVLARAALMERRT